MKKVPMTVVGAQKLREELNRLKTVDRPRIIAAIAEARALGDLKENAAYHDARENQSFAEGRIKDIEGKLSTAQIIDITQIENSGRVIFGVTVSLVNTTSEEQVTYQIVGEDEADIKANKLSITSPIARALIGKNIDDAVEVQTPQGVISFEIVNVEHI